MQVQFNTKRHYTEHGQRIIATLHPDNVVTFYDIDRMVDGQFEFDSTDELQRFFKDKESAAQIIMQRYDWHAYKRTKRSSDDAFTDDGCNAVTRWKDESPNDPQTPQEKPQHYVTGAIERGEDEAIPSCVEAPVGGKGQQIARANFIVHYGNGEWRATILTTPDAAGQHAAYAIGSWHPSYDRWADAVDAACNVADIFDACLASGTKVSLVTAVEVFGGGVALNYRR